MRPAILAAGVFVALSLGCGGGEPVMTAGDALALPRPVPDAQIAYGPNALQFGELRVPRGEGPHPVALVIHGGCWLAEYDLGYVAALADALAGEGIATWSIEYRRVGDDGGGWPGTFLDVAAAADTLRQLASEHELDLGRVLAVGHSAGGHLALWLAARARLDVDDPLRGGSPLPITGVVALAGIPDLKAYASPDGCGAAVPALLGGQPAEVPHRLALTSPMEMVPLGVRQILVTGGLDAIVPASQAREYQLAARAAGDSVEIIEVAGAGHFELIVPAGSTWATVRDAIRRLADLPSRGP